RRLARLAAGRRGSRDLTGRVLTEAFRDVVACFPVYRSYVGDDGETVRERDRARIDEAVAAAKRRSPSTSASACDFIREVLRGAVELDVARRVQQLTGPVAAKGVEDTAHYRYHRLTALNEVGGSPDRFGTTLAEFHRLNAERQAHWPHSLSATSTHD